jgi:hypothetical protein
MQHQKQAARLRIEDLNPRTLVAALDLPSSNVHFDPAKLGHSTSNGGGTGEGGDVLDVSLVPEQLAIHASASKERDVLEWNTLQVVVPFFCFFFVGVMFVVAAVVVVETRCCCCCCFSRFLCFYYKNNLHAYVLN